jgi:hypothetical protein
LSLRTNDVKVFRMTLKRQSDNWPTTEREAYNDRPHYREAPIKKPSREGNPFLRSVGGTLMVTGIAWGAYIFVTRGGTQNILQTPGPVVACVAGIVLSLIARLF